MIIVVEIIMRLVSLVKCGSPLPADFVPYNLYLKTPYDTCVCYCGHALVESA